MNQDPIGLWSWDNLYQFAPNAQIWIDYWRLARLTNISELRRQIRGQIKAMNKIIQEEGMIGLKARILGLTTKM